MQKENIIFRIEKSKKEQWRRFCKKQGITLTNLIVNSVENRAWDSERRKALTFFEKQINLFAKVENNINQQAKYVNAQKFMTKEQIAQFVRDLAEVKKLKQEQNEILKMAYRFIAYDHQNFKFCK